MKKIKLMNYSFVLTVIMICTSFTIPKQTTIPSNKAWTDTGYAVNIGDIIEINTSGDISVNETIKCNSDGVPNRPDLQTKNCEIKSANFGCLIGKIGEKGEPFFVGKIKTMVSNGNGKLFLGINDQNLKNNTGEFLSIITITNSKKVDPTIK